MAECTDIAEKLYRLVKRSIKFKLSSQVEGISCIDCIIACSSTFLKVMFDIVMFIYVYTSYPIETSSVSTLFRDGFFILLKPSLRRVIPVSTTYSYDELCSDIFGYSLMFRSANINDGV
jgi:hypothetical protein